MISKLMRKSLVTALTVVISILFGCLGMPQAVAADKYGVIDKTGNVVITGQFEYVAQFADGLAVAKVNGKYGYIDKNGRMVIPAQFEELNPFADGLANVKVNGKWGYMDKSGRMVIPEQFEDCSAFADGLANVKVNGKWGYIDKSGRMVIPAQFEVRNSFADGLAYVKVNDKWGYIDKSGRMVILAQFENLSSFANGLANVKVNGKWGYIDKSGRMVIPAQFDYAEVFSVDGLARVKIVGKWGYIDKNGRMVIPAQFDDVRAFSVDGLAGVKIGGKWGYIDKTGRMVIPVHFEDGYWFAEGLAIVKDNGKWGCIDKTGNRVIPAQFEEMFYYFAEGRAGVKVNGKWGYIDKTGQMVIPAQFEFAWNFADGLASVEFSDIAKEHVEKGLAYLNQGEFDLAISECTQAIAINPEYAWAYNCRGVAYYRQNYRSKKNRDLAIADYSQAIALDPKYANAYTNRGTAYCMNGEYPPFDQNITPEWMATWYDRGLAEYATALSIDPNNEVAKNGQRDAIESKQRMLNLYKELGAFNEKYTANQYIIGDEVLVIQWHSSIRDVDYGYSAIVRSIDSPYVTLEIVDFYNVNSNIEGGPATGGEDLYKSRDIGKMITIKATEITKLGRIIKKQQQSSSNSSNIPWVGISIHMDNNSLDLVDWQIMNYATNYPTEESPGNILTETVTTGTAVHRNTNSIFAENLAGKYRWKATYKNSKGVLLSYSGAFNISGTKNNYLIRIHDDGSDDGSYEY